MTRERPRDGSAASPARKGAADRASIWLLWIGILFVFGSIALLWTRAFAFDEAVRLTVRLLSADGSVTPAGRSSFAAILLSAAAVTATLGLLIMASAFERTRRVLVAVVTWDALRSAGRSVPNPYGMLTGSSFFGLLVVGLWVLRSRVDPAVGALFAKEGPFEHLTFVLALAASVLCGVAAYRSRSPRAGSRRLLAASYGLCALVLFVVAMEEISWGQTFFGFHTPASWNEINHQGETSLHNLVDREALNAGTRSVAVALLAATLLLVAFGARMPHSLAGALAPPASLGPLMLITVYSAFQLHEELVELLLATFFALYGYRVCVAARVKPAALTSSPDPQHAIVAAPLDEPTVPIAAAEDPIRDQRRLAETELLEYTHDAIIVWEMGDRGIRYWNRAAEQLYGYTRHEAYGRTTHELLRTELAGGVERLESTIARYGIWVGELRHTTKEGHKVDVQGRLALMSQQNGRWLVLEVNRDITDHKEAEIARHSLEQQLVRLNWLHWKK